MPELGDAELEVLKALWDAGPGTVRQVLAHLHERKRRVAYTTVLTVLTRLEQKGYVHHEVEGRAYIYRAVEAPRSLAARAFRHIVDRFCHGSVDELVSGLVEANVLDDAELAALEASLKARARGRAPKRKKG